MRTITLALLLTFSFVSLAYTPVIILTEGWKSHPIVVKDNLDYFYSHEVCPPQITILPNTICGVSPTIEINQQDYYLKGINRTLVR